MIDHNTISYLVAETKTAYLNGVKYCLVINKQNRDEFFSKYPTDNILRGTLKKYKGDKRSLRQNRLYWKLLSYLEINNPLPEHINKSFVETFGMERITADAWHSIFKAQQKKTSTAFENLDHIAFTEYFENVLKWLSKIMGVTSQDIIDNI